MKQPQGFAWLPLLLAVVAVLGISGGAYFYKNPQKIPSINISPTPTASTTPATQTAEQDPRVRFVESPVYGIHPAKEDWLVISADAPDMSVDLTGWTVRSTESGKNFIIKPLGTAQNIAIGSSDTALFIHTVGSPSKSYRAGSEVHLYFGESAIAWGTGHDTIQLVNPSGVVVDTYSYPAQAEVSAPSAEITAGSLAPWLISSSADKVISGSASNITSVGVYVVMSGKVADEWHTAYANDQVTVDTGHWSITVPGKNLNCNAYDVFVYGNNKAILSKGSFVGTGCDTNPNH